MESETIELTDSSPERDCNATNHSDGRTINESTQIYSNGISVNTSAAVEKDTDMKSEGDVLYASQDTQNDELQNDNKVTERSMDDSESTEEVKDSNAENTREEHKGNEKPGDNCSTQGSIEAKKEVDISGKRIAKKFRVLLSNRKVDKIFFGTVDKPIPNKVETWRIRYDDGDVDIMSHDEILGAMRYYDINRKYDTNRFHKIPTSPLLHESEEEDEKGGNNKTQPSIAKDLDNRSRTGASPPKRGKKTSAKVARKEPIPVWTGPPDEQIDGGWPMGVSENCFVFLHYRIFTDGLTITIQIALGVMIIVSSNRLEEKKSHFFLSTRPMNTCRSIG